MPSFQAEPNQANNTAAGVVAVPGAAAAGAAGARRHGTKNGWRLTAAMWRVVVKCFCLADGVADPAIGYLRHQGRMRHWPEKSDEELRTIVLDATLGATRDELIALCDMGSASDEQANSIAVRLVEEWRLSECVRAANLEGVAPSTSSAR